MKIFLVDVGLQRTKDAPTSLGHHILAEGIKVDLKKIEMIQQLETLKNQIYVNIFLGHAGYYQRFIENFSKIAAPYFLSSKRM